MWRTGAKVAAYALVALACVFFLRQLWTHHERIPSIEWSTGSVVAILLSLLGTLATIVLIAIMWLLLLKDQGVKLSFHQALRIIAVTQMGKYLPGNIGHFAGRAVLAQRIGVPVGKTLTTIAIETVWTLAISTAFAFAAVVFFADAGMASLGEHLRSWHLALAGGVLLFAPLIGIRVLNAWLPGVSRKLGKGELVTPPRLGTAAAVAGMMMLCYFILGAVLKVQTQVLFGSAAGSWLQLTLLFTAAWVAGYILPGAPGGLGVREAMMLTLLGPVLGTSVALGVSLTMRLTSMAGDGLAFVGGWLMSGERT